MSPSEPPIEPPSHWPARPAWQPTRRDFLRALGLVGGASTLSWAGAQSVAAAIGPAPRGADPSGSDPPAFLPETDPAEGWRRPGGPTIEQLAADLRYDVDAIFRFVTDEVQYDPYVGALRGATGALWSRGGNSVDQALLLRALLDAALVPTRLVTGTLDDAAVARLTDAATLDLETLQRNRQPVFRPSGTPHAMATRTTLLPDEEQAVRELPQRAAELRGAALDQLASGVAAIGAALHEAGIELPVIGPVLPERERREHMWVQYASGAEWIDLDPSIAGSAAGDTLAEASALLDELPRALRHAVTIGLSVDVVRGGRIRRESLLTYELFSDELAGRAVSIGHSKPEGLDGLGAALTGTLDGSLQYVPMLLVGDEGEIAPNRVTFNTGAGLASVLDFGIDGPDTEGETLAEWLELTIDSPDAGIRTVTRPIFDRIGDVVRQAGDIDPASIPPIELVDVSPEMPNEFLPLRALWSIGITGGSVPWDYFDQDPAIGDVFADFALVSEGYHLVRETLGVELAAATAHRHAPAVPHATAFVAGPRVGAGGVEIESAIDLLTRDVAAVPLATAGAAAGGAAAFVDAHPLVVAGVLAHVAERLCTGDLSGDRAAAGTGTTAKPLRRLSVGRVFEAAAREGVPIVGVVPIEQPVSTDAADAADDGLDHLDVSADARLRIAAARHAGLVVIVPQRAVELDGTRVSGWWLVDPLTGITLDEFEDGRGATLTEHIGILSSRFRAWGGFARLGGCVGKHATIAAAALGVAGSYPGFSEATGIALGAAQAAVEAAGNFALAC